VSSHHYIADPPRLTARMKDYQWGDHATGDCIANRGYQQDDIAGDGVVTYGPEIEIPNNGKVEAADQKS